MATKPTANPAGVVTSSPVGPSVSPGMQSQTRALQRAVSATSGRRSISNLPALVREYETGVPEQYLSERQSAQQQLLEAQQKFEGIKPFEERQFTQPTPQLKTREAMRAMPLLLVMTTLGGKRTKGNALGMMKAMTAGMKGLQEGNERGYKMAMTDYQANYDEFARREEVRRSQYDLLKQAAKDGVQVAKTRYENSLKAIDDYNKDTAENLRLGMTLAQAQEKLLESQRKAREPVKRTWEKSAFESLPKPRQDTLTQAISLYTTFDRSAKIAEEMSGVGTPNMKKEGEGLSDAIGRMFFPILDQMVDFAQYKSKYDIQSAEDMIDALKNAEIQTAISDLIRRNAGLSQTGAEIKNIYKAIGSNKIMQADAFYRLKRALAEDMRLFSKGGDMSKAAFQQMFDLPENRTADDLAVDAQKELDAFRAKIKSGTSQSGVRIKTFRSEAEAEAAWRAGKLKSGERVIIDGEEGIWE